MILTNNVVAKFAVAFVAAAMMFSALAPVVKAADVEDMSLDELIALVMQLQAQLSGSTSTGSSSCVSIPAPLTIGAQNANVTNLQNRLIADGQVIPAGATGYFGTQTQAAVAGWQAAHGVSPAVGYYGPITMAAMDAACVPTTPTTPDEGDGDTGSSVTLSGEADLNVLDVNSADDDQIQEGDSEAEIAEVTVGFTNGDAEISRLDVQLLADGDSNTNSVRPWDAFDTLSLWVDGDKIAEVDANSKSDYLDDKLGTIRFSGLDLVGMEDEEMVITVVAEVQTRLNAAERTDWDFYVTSMRYFDADGVATTETTGLDFGTEAQLSGAANATFAIKVAGYQDEAIVKTSSSDLEARTIQVKDNAKSGWETVFIFDIDTDDSINDITLNDVDVLVTLGSSTIAYNTIVDDAELIIDGKTINSGSADVTGGNALTGTSTINFDVDGDVTIDAGDRVKAELRLRFKSLAAVNEGITVQASVAGSDIDAEGADDFTGTGSATGKVHSLRTTGVEVAIGNTSAVVTTGQNNLDDYATYVISMDVTAFNQDVFIPINTASTTWDLVDSNNASVNPQTGSTSVVMTSSADEGGASNGFFQINEGQTETVTLTVTYTPSIANTAARLQLTNFVFDETGTVTGADDAIWTAAPASTYRTPVVTIVN